MEQPDVYLLAGCEPYKNDRYVAPINTIVVHASMLLHAAVPQPDGSNIYRCLTAFPGRAPGEVVPLSTITAELAGGAHWPRIGDWNRVVEVLARLLETGQCRGIACSLTGDSQQIILHAPTVSHHFEWSDGRPDTFTGPEDRRALLVEIEETIQSTIENGHSFIPDRDLSQPGPYPPVDVYAPVLPDGYIRHRLVVIPDE